MYKKAAALGSDEAIFILGKLYFQGKHIKQDLEKSFFYFEKIAAYEDQKAQYNLATIYANKKFSKHSYTKSYNMFLKLAQENYPEAQNKVGLFLLYGIGIEKDYKEAIRWFEKSYFEHNYIPASCNLALMYANGYGVFFNFGRASLLAKKGLEQKLPTCIKIYQEFNLHKYPQDKGFKTGYYSDI